jgi:hypothetical protein
MSILVIYYNIYTVHWYGNMFRIEKQSTYRIFMGKSVLKNLHLEEQE